MVRFFFGAPIAFTTLGGASNEEKGRRKVMRGCAGTSKHTRENWREEV
jgi:hypothetical protein